MASFINAEGILSLLDEEEGELKVHALQELNTHVDKVWSAVAPSILKIESLYDDETFQDRELAAVVASKVFYHLEELDDALKYALRAGKNFDLDDDTSEFVHTLVSKCIDEYIALRIEGLGEGKDASPPSTTDSELELDTDLVAVIERMFDSCFANGNYKQALGIAVECRRLDIVKKAIGGSGSEEGLMGKNEMLKYAFRVSQEVISNRTFRHELLLLLVDLYSGLSAPDHLSMCQCWLLLNDYFSVAACLDKLINSADAKHHIIALQVAFDLNQNQYVSFMKLVVSELTSPEDLLSDAEKKAVVDMYSRTSEKKKSTSVDGKQEAVDADQGALDSYGTRMIKLKRILTGDVPVNLYLKFLYQHNKTDLNLLKKIKNGLAPRNSVTHNATIFAHALMQCGTTNDNFLANNLHWLRDKFKNWAKFMVTASIGVIHRGHVNESEEILKPYLPVATANRQEYSEGGALFALGLIHTTNANNKTEYLLSALRDYAGNETMVHGACLGLGLSNMASQNQELWDELKAIVFGESAIAGEAAAVAIGLILMGSGNSEALEELLTFARESHDEQHEKVTRGIAMALAMISYGQEENADTLIAQMSEDKDPILRYGAMYTIALAYAATGNNSAIRRLLHVAVSDVSNDVRRAAVTCLAFVLSNNPTEVPKIVALLSESYNPHVRYGACMAVGIACAGTGSLEATNLLEPLLRDRVDYVRQSAFIALGMVFMQQNEKAEPKVGRYNKSVFSVLAGRGDTMTKLGAILGQGIMNAGGRNVSISLLSPSGFKKMEAVVGMAMFQQFWYWHPFINFLSLSFTPTTVIGLNKNLQMPESFNVVSNAKPSLFAYPEEVSLEVKKEAVELKKATLSTSSKAKRKAKEKKNAEVDADGDVKMGSVAASEGETKEAAEEAEKKPEPEPEPEAESAVLANPSRVTPLQWKHVTLSDVANSRYQLVKKLASGFVMLQDTTPDVPERIVVPHAPGFSVPGVSADEPEAPEPFELPERYL